MRDLTAGMKKALANRDETLKVVSEVIKAPVEVLDTYLLKPNDFAREPGAAPNFAGIQAMFDIYAETGMIKREARRRPQFRTPASWRRSSESACLPLPGEVSAAPVSVADKPMVRGDELSVGAHHA